MRPLICVLLLSCAGLGQAQAAADCATGPAAAVVDPAIVPAVSVDLAAPSHQLGAPSGVLADAFDASQSVESVLLRRRLEACQSVANAAPASTPAAADGVIDPASYKPKTEFDNKPWRFDMNQNGKRMTAEEFDAWMKARGVRVAKGGAVPASTASAEAAAPASTTDAPESAEKK